MTAKTDIEALFAKVAADALKSGVTFENRVEALKILKPYYEILTKKAGKLPPEPSESGPHFGDFQADMSDPPAGGQGERPNGSAKVRGHRRN